MHSLVKKIKYNALSCKFYDLFLRLAPDKTKAFIFVATTGRSGTKSLRTIFCALNKCASFHEPYPLVGNNCPQGVDRNKYYQDLFYKRKLPIIRMSSFNHHYYVETNHQFIKHFAEPAIDAFGPRIRIIHLVRDPIKVASSFFSLDSIPGVSSRGGKYLLDPSADDNIIQIGDLLGNRELSHDFFKCVWYWYEVEARVRRLKDNFPELKWYELETAHLNKAEVVQDMFATFDLPVGTGFGADPSVRENLKMETKTRKIAPAEAESMHEMLVCKMEERYGREFWIQGWPTVVQDTAGEVRSRLP